MFLTKWCIMVSALPSCSPLLARRLFHFLGLDLEQWPLVILLAHFTKLIQQLDVRHAPPIEKKMIGIDPLAN